MLAGLLGGNLKKDEQVNSILHTSIKNRLRASQTVLTVSINLK